MTEDKELNNKLYDLALEKNDGVPAPRGFGHHIDELNKKIADLEAKLAELNKEPLNCSQLKNGMSLCVIQKSKIAELEAKLAESNASCILLEGLRNYEAEKKDIAMKRVSELKQQLEEKEEEIKKLTLLYFGDENTETILTTNKMIQHIKISFAVEQLEKVKELFESCWDYEFDIGELCNKGIFYNKIEQLIAELTHQHEDEGE